MWAIIAQIVAQLGGTLLQEFMQRKDVKDEERHQIEDAAREMEIVALKWRIAATGDPDAAARLQDLGGKLSLPPSSGTPGKTD